MSIRDWGRDCYCMTGKSGSCGKRFSMKMGKLPYGYDHKYIYSNIGYNLKITEMQSAIGIAQLPKLGAFIEKRNSNFMKYYCGLAEFADMLELPIWHKKASPSWFGFPITVKKGIDRLGMVKHLEDAGIETRLVFGGNITRQPALLHAKVRIPASLQSSDTIMNNTFFIGVYPGLTDEMISYVISTIKKYLKRKK